MFQVPQTHPNPMQERESYAERKEVAYVQMLVQKEAEIMELSELNEKLLIENEQLENRLTEIEELASESMQMCAHFEARVIELTELNAKPMQKISALEAQVKELQAALIAKDSELNK